MGQELNPRPQKRKASVISTALLFSKEFGWQLRIYRYLKEKHFNTGR